jgi:AraC-like DNA-binding protein
MGCSGIHYLGCEGGAQWRATSASTPRHDWSPALSMSVILDTRSLSPCDRFEAFQQAFSTSTVPTDVSLDSEDGRTEGLIELWNLGVTDVFQVSAPDISLTRTARHVRRQTADLVAIVVQRHATGQFAYSSGESVVNKSGEMTLVDLTSPHDFSWKGNGSAISFKYPYADFAVAPELVRKAVPRLRFSSIYHLVSDHFLRLAQDIEKLSVDASVPDIAHASLLLVRALIESVVDEGSTSRSSGSDTLWPLILAYVESHLTERDLTPGRIARANNISLRYLYKLGANHDVRIAELIVRRRLEGARRELQSTSKRTIAAVAHGWGFIDPAHFSERFRHAYGESPREWRMSATPSSEIPASSVGQQCAASSQSSSTLDRP